MFTQGKMRQKSFQARARFGDVAIGTPEPLEVRSQSQAGIAVSLGLTPVERCAKVAHLALQASQQLGRHHLRVCCLFSGELHAVPRVPPPDRD